MKSIWKDNIYRNAYLLIAAAWLFTLSFIFSNYWSYTSSPQGVRKNLEKYLSEREKDFFHVLSDTTLIHHLLQMQESEAEMKEMTDKNYGLFIYRLEDSGPIKLAFWNTQQSQPTDEMLVVPDGEYLVDLPNGQYELIRRKLTQQGRENILVLCLIPIRWNFYIENDYLRNGFADHPNVEKNYSLSETPTAYPVKNSRGKILYYLEEKERNRVVTNDWITIMLRILGSLLLLFYFHMTALIISRRRGAGWGILFLVVVVVSLRILTYYVNIPIDFRQFELFSPAVYGSSVILKSLGDLLINAMLFFWVALFARLQINRLGITLKAKNRWMRRFIPATLLIMLCGLTLVTGNIIRSLVADSQISFDVINFFSLNIYSIFGFIVLCGVSMGYFIASHIILKFVNSFPEATYLFKVLVITVAGLAYLSTQVNTILGFQMGLLAWLLVYISISQYRLLNGSVYLSGSAVVYWLVIFSASITLVISNENRNKELERRKRIAEKLAWQADPSSEKLLSLAIGSLNNIFWQNNIARFSNDKEGAKLKDSIINANFSAYLNRFETSFYVFDPGGNPLSGYETMNFDTLNTIYTMQGKKTGIINLRYYETAFDRFSYIFQREVRDTANRAIALVFMLSNPRRYKSEAMIPELFRQPEEFSFERSPLYAYAVYDKNELITNVNDYPFPTRLNPSETDFSEWKIMDTGGYRELWYRQGGDRIVVISRRSNILLEAITLFAYLFCAFLFLVGLFQLTNVLVRSGFRWKFFRESFHFSIKNQIFTTIIFISLFSFFIIGAATIIFFINRYNKNNQEKLSRTIQVMSNELQKRISGSGLRSTIVSPYDSSGIEEMRKDITDISEIHNVDINLYDTLGYLSMSSQPLVYSKGIISRMMDPVAYYQMRIQRRIQHVQNEKTSLLKYLSIYVPVKGDYRNTEAYLNIPYFTSSLGLNQEISNFLVTIINLNAFIFLIAGVIAVFLTNRITNSFSWIGDKMRQINLGRHNEEITWGRRDEIGGLISEYNKMVRKLEQSAVDMAKSEREGAWREMARQVAHEIKNPLTPMKLSIQYLQKAIDNNAPNVKELSSSVAGTLIEQIEHLAKIASEFSQFANIGNTRNELFDLHELLYSLVSLHSVNENATVEWQPVQGKAEISADRTQINRLFTNLLQNALEAIPANRRGEILLREMLSGQRIIITVEDNGDGIPPEMKSKIFSPNFTTKSSGTGLGLAMSKGIVEQAKGEIWFESNSRGGTSFFVALPLQGLSAESESQAG